MRKGKNDILFSFVCVWAIIFFAGFFVVIGSIEKENAWNAVHCAESELQAYAEDDGAEKVNGDIGDEFIKIKAESSENEKNLRAIITASVCAVISGAVCAAALRKREQGETKMQ